MTQLTNAPTRSAALTAPDDQAVSYLRVSSKRQMDTAIDIDPDGNSIEAVTFPEG